MNNKNIEKFELLGNAHQMTFLEILLRPDVFTKSDEGEIKNIAKYFYQIIEELGLDLEDDSLSRTPHKVAKMYVKKMFAGLHTKNKPKLSVFDNEYNKMLIERDITFNAACEHHFLPIVGRADVGYVSSSKVINLSKINRAVNYSTRRPQVQERMSIQIFSELKEALHTDNVIVVVESEHTCVSTRGLNNKFSKTTTIE